ncbi:MAG: ferrous iron transport protein A [Desulfatitalea sp.]|nr:ferrous iron transport protein A [Desulfatitalea sp.]
MISRQPSRNRTTLRECLECPTCAKPLESRHDGCRFLTDVANGCRCRIRRHRSQGAIRQRLLDLGFVPGVEVEMVRCATLGDPLEMRLGDYYVTLRKREADLIEIAEG